MTAPTMTFTVSLAPDLETEYRKAQADEAAAALIANRSDDEKMRTDAAALLDRHRATREALEDRIAESIREITVTRLAPKAYARLVVEHPPRPGDHYDARMGFNTDTFDSALMDACITSVVDARGDDTDLDWDEAAAAMAFGQYQHIITTVIGMHTSRDAIPFSLDDWRARQT